MRRQHLVRLTIALSFIVLGSTQASAFNRCEVGDCRQAPGGNLLRGPRWDYAAAHYNQPVYVRPERRGGSGQPVATNLNSRGGSSVSHAGRREDSAVRATRVLFDVPAR